MADFRLGDLTWRARASYAAHLFKAMTKQHHRPLRPLLATFIPRDAVVCDVGGHAGQFTKLFAKLSPEGRVYSFEPGGYALSILRTVMAVHRFGNVTIVAKGLGDMATVGTLTVPRKYSGTVRFGISHLGSASPGDHPGQQETIEITTLDQFANEQAFTRLDFIKADIEGWELRMLAGGEAAIRRFRPVLMVELNESFLARAGDNLAAVWQTLEGWGYRAVQLYENGNLRWLSAPNEGDIVWLPAERAQRLVAGDNAS